MKILLVRLGVLGSVIALGWITIANGQRSNDGPNPLRGTAAARDNGAAASDERPVRRPPSSDPFDLQSRRDSPSYAPGSAAARRDPKRATARNRRL